MPKTCDFLRTSSCLEPKQLLRLLEYTFACSCCCFECFSSSYTAVDFASLLLVDAHPSLRLPPPDDKDPPRSLFSAISCIFVAVCRPGDAVILLCQAWTSLASRARDRPDSHLGPLPPTLARPLRTPSPPSTSTTPATATSTSSSSADSAFLRPFHVGA